MIAINTTKKMIPIAYSVKYTLRLLGVVPTVINQCPATEKNIEWVTKFFFLFLQLLYCTFLSMHTSGFSKQRPDMDMSNKYDLLCFFLDHVD